MLILIECFDKKERTYLPHILIRLCGTDKESLTKTKTFLGKSEDFDYNTIRTSAITFKSKDEEDNYLMSLFKDMDSEDLET